MYGPKEVTREQRSFNQLTRRRRIGKCKHRSSSGGIAQGFDFSLSDLSARFLTARNCMSLILKMKTSTESGLW